MKGKKKPGKGKAGVRPDAKFCSYFTHWRTGKRYYARDYGWDAWPIGRRPKR